MTGGFCRIMSYLFFRQNSRFSAGVQSDPPRSAPNPTDLLKREAIFGFRRRIAGATPLKSSRQVRRPRLMQGLFPFLLIK